MAAYFTNHDRLRKRYEDFRTLLTMFDANKADAIQELDRILEEKTSNIVNESAKDLQRDIINVLSSDISQVAANNFSTYFANNEKFSSRNIYRKLSLIYKQHSLSIPEEKFSKILEKIEKNVIHKQFNNDLEELNNILNEKHKKSLQRFIDNINPDISDHYKQRFLRQELCIYMHQLMQLNSSREIIKQMNEQKFEEFLKIVNKMIERSYYTLKKTQDKNLKKKMDSFFAHSFKSEFQEIIDYLKNSKLGKKILEFQKNPINKLMTTLKSFIMPKKKDDSPKTESQTLMNIFNIQPFSMIIPKPSSNLFFFLLTLGVFLIAPLTIVSVINGAGLFLGFGFGLFAPLAIVLFIYSVVKITYSLLTSDSKKVGGMNNLVTPIVLDTPPTKKINPRSTTTDDKPHSPPNKDDTYSKANNPELNPNPKLNEPHVTEIISGIKQRTPEEKTRS